MDYIHNEQYRCKNAFCFDNCSFVKRFKRFGVFLRESDMALKESTAQDFLSKIKEIPRFIKSRPRSPGDLALLAFEFRHRKEKPADEPIQTRRARAVGTVRKASQDAKIDLGLISFDSEHNFYRGFSDDVENGGIFVATYNVEPVGTPISVSFELPGNKQVFTRGVVQYTREISSKPPTGCISGMGISFSYLENEDKTVIESYQEERTPIFFDV
jgi:Tfp pilus assembly protein PilZ